MKRVVKGVVGRNHGMAVIFTLLLVLNKLNWAGCAYIYSHPMCLADSVWSNFVCSQVTNCSCYFHARNKIWIGQVRTGGRFTYCI
jgi:hypothetical protein